MGIVTTNIRLPEEKYQKYRLIALRRRTSFAELVRQSLEKANWQYEDHETEKKSQQAAGRLLKVKRFKSPISIREMIERGRRY